MSLATLPATAARLINKYGKAVVVTRKVQGAYNLVTSRVDAPTTITFTVKMTLTVTRSRTPDLSNAGHMDFLTRGTAVLLGDVLAIDGQPYRVRDVRTEYAGENVVISHCQGERE